jgi:hypothetical protein
MIKPDTIVTISVTQEDIDKGNRYESSSCPIALAIHRNKECQSVRVGSDKIIFEDLNGEVHNFIHLSKEIKAFVKKFDTCKKVKPFEFELHF